MFDPDVEALPWAEQARADENAVLLAELEDQRAIIELTATYLEAGLTATQAEARATAEVADLRERIQRAAELTAGARADEAAAEAKARADADAARDFCFGAVFRR